MKAIALIAFLILPNGHYKEFFVLFGTMKECEEAIPVAMKEVEKMVQIGGGYIVKCAPVMTKPVTKL